jgi:hypothetical protein
LPQRRPGLHEELRHIVTILGEPGTGADLRSDWYPHRRMHFYARAQFVLARLLQLEASELLGAQVTHRRHRS